MSFNCPKEFFKIMQEHELGGELRVPKRFVERHWHQISNPVVLKFPNGVQQEIFWAKRDGDIWLQKNWEKIANFLKYGYVVVFEYKGRSCFKVKIFGVNTLEIDYSNMKVIDETYKAKEVVELSDDSDKSLDVEFNDVGTSQRRKSGKRKNNLDFDATQQNFSSSKRGGMINKTKKCSTSGAVNERTINENPSFEIKLSRSYALPDGYLLRIPSDFSREYLNEFDEFAHIRCGEDMAMEVYVKFEDAINNRSRASIITSGWKLFAKKYNLQVGDKCKFEMTQRQPLSFTVTRARGMISSCDDSIGKRRGMKRTSRSFHVFSNSEEGHDVMKPKTTLEICVNSSYPYIKNEFFKRNAKELNGKFVKLKMGTKYWYVKVRYYEKLATCRFYRGWRKFKEDCKLENGDKCLLELVDEKELVFEVSIKKLVFDV